MMPGMTSRIMRMRGMIINSKFANFPLVYNTFLLALTDAYPGGRMNSGIEDATIVATQMVLAAANEGAGPLDNHFKRKDLSETVSYL